MTMTHDNDPLRPLAKMISDLLDADLPESIDALDFLRILHPFMPTEPFHNLCIEFDMCPIHFQDLDSCADDDEPNEEIFITDTLPALDACRYIRRRR